MSATRTDAARDVWARQLADVQRALEPYRIHDGAWVGYDPTEAPTALLDALQTLSAIGYARGWVA